MASETTTICFRVPVRERELLEAVAHFYDQSLSAFARDKLLTEADRVLQESGTEALIKKDREYEERRLRAASRKVEARREGLSSLQDKEEGAEWPPRLGQP